MIKKSIILFAALLLGGCSIPFEVYLRNLTSYKQRITLEYLNSPKSNKIYFKYNHKKQDINYNSKGEFIDSILAIKKDSNLYELELPSNSVLYLDFGINGHSIQFKSIKVEEKKLIKDNYYIKDFIKKTNFVNNHVIWYDIH